MRFALTVSLVLLVGLSSPVLASQSVSTTTLPRFEVQLPEESVTVGETFRVEVEALHPARTTISLPEHLALGQHFVEVARSSTREIDGEVLMTRLSLDLMALDSRIAEFPALSLDYRDGTGIEQVRRTEPQAISLGLHEKSGTLRPLVGPVTVSRGNWQLIFVGAVAICILLLTLILLLVLRRGETRTVLGKSRHRVLPGDEGLAQLNELETKKASGRLEEADLKQVYLEMSEILRTFLERQLAFPALDLTTREIGECVHEIEGEDASLEVTAWLENCDMVKFANSASDADQAREALYAARVLIAQVAESGRRNA